MTNKLVLSYSSILVFSIILWFYANWNGLGLTDDSYYYLELSEKSSRYCRPQHLYSFLLSFTDLYKHEAAAVINFCSYLGAIIIWLHLVDQNENLSKASKVLFLAFACFSPTMLLVSSFLWAECIFILCLSFSFLCFKYWIENFSLKWLLGMLLAIIFSIWARKVGLLLLVSLPMGILMKYLDNRSIRWVATMIFIGTAMVLWKFFYTGEQPTLSYLSINLVNNVNGIINWFVPVSFPLPVRIFFLLLVFGLLIFPSQDAVSRWVKVFFCLYFVVRLFPEREFVEESDRYFSILYIPILYHLFSVFSVRVELGKKYKLFLYSTLLAICLLNLSRSVNSSRKWNETRNSTATSEEIPSVKY